MRYAAIVIACLIAFSARAQNSEEYPVVIRDAIAPPGEFLIPTPAGWEAACVGLRNTSAQHLATIDYYNDSLKAFAQTALPQIMLRDAVFAADASPDSSRIPAMFVLAEVHNAFSLYRVGHERSIVKHVTIEPGEQGLTPQRCSLEFIGADGGDGCRLPVFYVLAHFHDAPLRHVIAAYTADGNAVWQFALGAESVHAFLAQPAQAAAAGYAPRILFSTDASSRESADTLHLIANNAYAAALANNGRLLWTALLGGAGTRSWGIESRGAMLCAADCNGEGVLFAFDKENGVTEQFRRIAGRIIPRTLCVADFGADSEAHSIVLANMPSIIAEYDSLLRDVREIPLASPIDSMCTVLAMSAVHPERFIMFTPSQVRIYSVDFHDDGVSPEGMEYKRTGINRFTGSGVGTGNIFCAQTAAGGVLRAAVSNPWWWWYRYRGITAIVFFWLAMGFGAFSLTKKYLFYRTYYNQLVRGSATTGVIALNRQQRVMYLNPAARELLQIASHVPLRRHISEYITLAAYAELGEAIRDCLSLRRGYEKIFTMQEGAQTKTFLHRIRPTITRGGALQGCILQVEDMTRTIERERLLNWASVAHHIAHEMKTPIGTVLLNAQHLQKSEEALPLNLRKYLLRIITQSDRLSAILQTFLRIARFNAMNLSDAPIAPLVQRLAADYAEMLPLSIAIQCVIRDPGARAAVDAEQLSTALRNILDNAVNAIKPAEGTISLTVATRAATALTSGRVVVIGIRDTGRGMSETCKARVFEPFYTETPGGSGIGMMIVKRIIEEHKGAVEIESEEGHGTEVRVMLPEAPAAE